MDQSEGHVRDYLEYLGLGRVVYQPDGNVPPDFLVGGRIAVEVRRLNENELTESGGFRGLETDRISTGRKFHALLRSLGSSKIGRQLVHRMQAQATDSALERNRR